jgi:hypothetical protein
MRSTWTTPVRSTKSFATTTSPKATTLPHLLEETTWTALANARTLCYALASPIPMVFALLRVEQVCCLMAHNVKAPILSFW